MVSQDQPVQQPSGSVMYPLVGVPAPPPMPPPPPPGFAPMVPAPMVVSVVRDPQFHAFQGMPVGCPVPCFSPPSVAYSAYVEPAHLVVSLPPAGASGESNRSTMKLRGSPAVVSKVHFAAKAYLASSKPVRSRIAANPSQPFIMFVEVTPITQIGPTCGLVALAMIVNIVKVAQVYDIWLPAFRQGFTLSGEMFSARNMSVLAREFLFDKCTVEIHRDNRLERDPDGIWQMLLDNVLLMVPYDNDVDNAPGFRRGNRAHWCVVIGCGYFNGMRYVAAVHGKSHTVSLWPLEVLARSNGQLMQTCPSIRSAPDQYIVCDTSVHLSGCIISFKFDPDVVLRVATNFNPMELQAYFATI